MISYYNKPIKIAVIGDVHDAWEADDGAALQHLGIDLALFVGDFGNESVEVVRAIASLDLPKAAILGNHDAWYSASPWGKMRCPYDRTKEDRVQQQIDLLGESHVGYGKLDFPSLNLTVVGSRPFSWGGQEWKNQEFYQELYGVTSFEESTRHIVEAASHAAHETIIFMGHSGPMGLGDHQQDPCGKDWHPIGGDYGDPDFAEAIAQIRTQGKSIPLVTFGHMHHQLRHSNQPRIPVVSLQGTVYLNAASVPRIMQKEADRLRNFSIISLQDNIVSQVSLLWLQGKDFTVASEQILYRRPESVVKPVYSQ